MILEHARPKLNPVIGLVVLILGLSNCVPAPTKPVLKPPVRYKKRYSPRQILNQLEQQTVKVKNCRVLASLQVESWGESKNVKAVMLLEPPSSVRMEFLSFIGQPVQFLVCHQGNFWLYAPSSHQAMTGEATRFNIYRLLGVNLELTEVVNILLARPTLIKTSSPILIQYLEGENKYLLEISNQAAQIEQSLWLDGDTLNPVQLVVRQQHQVNLRVHWDDYQLIESVLFPTAINIQRPLEDTQVQVTYSDFNLNKGIAADMFALEIPPHMEWVKLPGSIPTP